MFLVLLKLFFIELLESVLVFLNFVWNNPLNTEDLKLNNLLIQAHLKIVEFDSLEYEYL